MKKQKNFAIIVLTITKRKTIMAKKKLENQKKRKLWYRGMKKLMLSRYKEPRFVYLGEKIGKGGMIL